MLDGDFDLGLIGIPEDELDALLHDADDDRAPIDDDIADHIPEPPAEPITKLGDIWRLGHHRLICGDATDPAVVARLMDGAQASLILTSPHYAQQRDYDAVNGKLGDWDALMQGVFAAAHVTADAQLLVNLGLVHRDGEWIPYWEGWVDWMRAQGWRRFGWYAWDQGPGLPGDRNGRLIAAERTGRRCCAVELDPVYCDVALRRWEMATGRAASRIVNEKEAQKPPRRSRKRA